MTRRPAAPRKRNRAEWITFIASSAVVAAVVVVIVFIWANGSAPAVLTATIEGPPTQRDGQFVVSVKVENQGDVSTADVQVVATLGGEPHGEQLVDFLSGGESVELAFVFPEDPAGLEVRVVSYRDP
ncbi:MAG: TIGR02588 family protein [Actinobacteria bacterium]|nr:TIGR02588 family protein [Actinomycetota bacterium]